MCPRKVGLKEAFVVWAQWFRALKTFHNIKKLKNIWLLGPCNVLQNDRTEGNICCMGSLIGSVH